MSGRLLSIKLRIAWSASLRNEIYPSTQLSEMISRYSTLMQRIKFRPWTIPLALLAVCLLTYGPLIHLLGFYWDDWPSIWFLHLFGPSGFQDAFAVDRPLLAWLFMVTTRLMGESVLKWQLFGILTRYLSCLALWWVLRSLWPRRGRLVTWIALLFAIYPGFRQQYISVTYSHDWIVQASFFVSLGMMIWALRKPNWYWLLIIPSWIIAAYAMFADEYYFGLELLRPVFLWLVLADKYPEPRKRAGFVVLNWTPYVVIAALFLVWRLFIHVSPRGSLILFDQLKIKPVAALLDLAKEILRNFFDLNVLAWLPVFPSMTLSDFGGVQILIYAGIVVAGALLVIYYLARVQYNSDIPEPHHAAGPRLWPKQTILLGLYAFFISGWPVWMTDMQIRLWFPWDRFSLMTMLGSALLIAGLIGLLPERRLYGALILGVLVGLAAGTQFQYRLKYHEDWSWQKAFFWQLAWRAPWIQPGTILLTSELPFHYDSDNSLTAPLNWTYDPQNDSREMSYLLYDVGLRQKGNLTDFAHSTVIEQPYRVTYFDGTLTQAVVLYYTPPNCLKVMDPQLDRKIPSKPRFISEVLSLSKLELILPQGAPPAQPPTPILGTEPEHDWCYAFEKAELARQLGEWEQIVRIGDQFLQKDFKITPQNAPELQPFIIGYALVGKWDRAVQLTMDAYHASGEMQIQLCRTWRYIGSESDAVLEQQRSLEPIIDLLQCGIP